MLDPPGGVAGRAAVSAKAGNFVIGIHEQLHAEAGELATSWDCPGIRRRSAALTGAEIERVAVTASAAFNTALSGERAASAHDVDLTSFGSRPLLEEKQYSLV